MVSFVQFKKREKHKRYEHNIQDEQQSRSSLHRWKVGKVIFCWPIFSTMESYMTVTNILKDGTLEEQ